MMSAKQQLEREIREAYLFLREKNMTVPSDTLEFMLSASLEKLHGLPDVPEMAEQDIDVSDIVEKVNTIKHLNLTDEQKTVACTAINLFGSGQHPVADTQTIDGFMVDYLMSIIKKNRKHFTDKAQIVLKEIEKKLIFPATSM